MGTVDRMGDPRKTPQRREYGSGSLFQRCDLKRGCPPLIEGVRPAHDCRGLWVARVVTGWDANGKQQRAQVTGKTEALVRRKLRDMKVQIENNGAPTVSPRTTVRDWATTWLKIQKGDLSPNGYRTTKGAVGNWIIPTFGHKRLSDVGPTDLRAMEAAILAKGRSTSTARRAHSDAVSMLKAAVVDGHTVKDGVFKMPAPEKAKSDRDAMILDRAIAVLPVAGELPHGSRFLAGLLEAMRQGECNGLTWDEVDMENGTITVCWQLQSLSYNVPYDRASGFRVPDGYEARQLLMPAKNDRNGPLATWHLVRPKSEAGWRVIPMVGPVWEALKAWREVQKVLIPDNPYNLVWPQLDGRPTLPKIDDEEWYAIQCAAGVGFEECVTGPRWYTIHETRHTTATLLLECGVDPAVIVQIMGHSDILTTRGYQHVRTAEARKALDLVAQKLALRPAA